jgi:peptidoglycan/LPS O-acetylase OafA/YrhL
MQRTSRASHAASTAGSGPKLRDHSFASLDVLRGLSALAVLIQHTDTLVSSTGRNIIHFALGSFAVDVFMLISGFLMMWHYYERSALGEKWTDSRTFGKFYIRRFFRIAPLYYFLLAVTFPLFVFLQALGRENAQALSPLLPFIPGGSWFTVGSVLTHLTFTFGFIPRFAAHSSMPDWSIGLEMQFYLFFPLLAIFLVRSRFIVAVAVLLLLKALTYHFFAWGYGAPPHVLAVFPYPTLLTFKIDNFLVGMLLAAGLYDRGHPAKRSFLFILALAVAGLYMRKFLLVCVLFLGYELAIGSSTGIPAINHAVGLARKFVGARLFKFMADTSYGVYLMHPVLLTLLVHFLIPLSFYRHLAPFPRLAFTLLVVTPVIYTLAYVTFRLIEEPGIALGRSVVKRLARRHA